jgi:hypothetical protein
MALRAVAGRGLSLRRQWLVVFLGFFLVFGSWSFAAPYDGPADEVQHVIRAVGVVSGQFAPAPAVVKDYKGDPGMGAYQHVPTGLLQHASCFGFSPHTSAACAKPIHGGPVGEVQTTAGRYNPLYYLLVGLPVTLAPSWGGLVGTRLLSAALSAALLAFSFVVLSRWSRYGLMLGGLIAAATPMLSHLAGAVNPNGLEIAAGIALFSAGIPLLLGPPRGRTAPLIWLAGISAAILATLRSLGPMWVFFALVVLLIPQSRSVLRQLWSRRLVRWWTAGVGLAIVLSLAWIVGMKTGSLVAPAQANHYTILGASFVYLNNWGNIYMQGLVGVAGWFDVFMPAPIYWLYIGVAGSLVVLAVVVGGWADRWRLFVLAFGGVVPIGVAQVAEVNTVGFIIGSRYMLPLLVGLPLLSAFILERKLLSPRQSRSYIRLFCVLLLPVHLVLLVYAMVRWQHGASPSHPNPFSGNWHPPTGSLLPLLLMIAGLLLVGWVTWTAPARIGGLNFDDSARSDSGDEVLAVPATREARLIQATVVNPSNGNGTGHSGPEDEAASPGNGAVSKRSGFSDPTGPAGNPANPGGSRPPVLDTH